MVADSFIVKCFQDNHCWTALDVTLVCREWVTFFLHACTKVHSIVTESSTDSQGYVIDLGIIQASSALDYTETIDKMFMLQPRAEVTYIPGHSLPLA